MSQSSSDLNLMSSGRPREGRIETSVFRLGDVVESNGAWKRVMEIKESRNGLFLDWLAGALGWHAEWNLNAVRIPPPKKEVGDTVIHHGE